MARVEHTIGKHTFTLSFNKEDLIKSANSARGEFNDATYVPFNCDYTDINLIDEDTYNKNIDDFINSIEGLVEESNLIRLIERAPKKKNGTFYKGRITDTVDCSNCVYITDWHNTWIYDQVVVKADSDLTLDIYFTRKTDTPG